MDYIALTLRPTGIRNEEAMTLHKITAITLLAGLAFGISLVLATSAEAQSRKRAPKYIYYGTQERVVAGRRGPTRITVYQRSFLSGGTESLQRDQRYTNYSHPPNYLGPLDRNDPKVSFSRSPMPDAWDIPGWPKY
jgi:hypothetical protein